MARDILNLGFKVLGFDQKHERDTGFNTCGAFLPSQESPSIRNKQQNWCYASSRQALTKEYATTATTDMHTGLRLHVPFTMEKGSWCTGHTAEG
jgi:hypothetical protein